MTIYLNGAWLPDEAATVNVRSRALNYGMGTLGGIRGYWCQAQQELLVFRLDDHLRRLANSAKMLCLAMPPIDDARALVLELLRRNEVRQDIYVRPLLLHDSDALAPILDPESTTFTMYCLPLQHYFKERALDVCISSWRRVSDNAIPSRAKSTGIYLNSALARREAMDNGFDEAIFLTDAGRVAEGSAEHVFIVRNGELVSPPSTEDNLDGITRRSLITMATEDLGLSFCERPIGRSELYVAEEMFLCGTGAQVTPVRSVDRRVIADGATGPLTRRLGAHFFEVVRGRVAHRRTWSTAVWNETTSAKAAG